MFKFRVFLFVVVSLVLAIIPASGEEFSTKDYGQLPFIRSVSISPDGKHLAYIQRRETGDAFIIMDAETRKMVGGADARKIKARSVYFVTNQHVILRVSQTAKTFNVRGKWENSGAYIYDLKTEKLKLLLKGSKDLYPAQGGLGRIVGINADKTALYMPAFVGVSSPSYSLLRVDMRTGRGRTYVRGTAHTIDWFVDRNGTVLAKEEYNEDKRLYTIHARRGKKWDVIFSEETNIPSIAIQGISADGKHLIFDDFVEEGEAIYEMSLADGSIQGPLYEVADIDIDRIVTKGLNREFSGILYSGLLPDYKFFNATQDDSFVAMLQQFPTSSVRPLSSTADKSKIIYLVSGNDAAGGYYMLDTHKMSLSRLASNYPNIKKENIGEIKVVQYKARDGLTIKAIVTWPVGVEERSNLPMLVLPHGGPEVYDRMEFDWWAQYFARSGYVVLQPNFRGSSGSGIDFMIAGRGEWGRAMQDDVSDGVNAMVTAGHVDPDRVCIMGASYGGYSALAGGAFTPDLYKCVVSVAGVSDLPLMLANVKSRRGRKHPVVSYWHEVIGDSKTEREKLKSISPANFAADFTAPVLLLHGRDDVVVPIAQSRRMMRALEKAGKQVEFVTLKGEDHWLSDSDTRLSMLDSISSFLQTHNPSDTR